MKPVQKYVLEPPYHRWTVRSGTLEQVSRMHFFLPRQFTMPPKPAVTAAGADSSKVRKAFEELLKLQGARAARTGAGARGPRGRGV